MPRFYLLLLLICFTFFVSAQSNMPDSLQTLSAITVKGFETNRKLLETPASISIITQKALQRSTGMSLVPVLNTVPGIRMEERSPGSYRLSVRGSLLRSPFGIRNIKVYLDDIPFTDAGGNTYLNLIDPDALGSVEILKGPASSLYGAGTGGAVILNEPKLITEIPAGKMKSDLKMQLQAGTYGLFAENLRWQSSKNNYGLQLTQSHIQSNGYRDNSRLRKDVIHFADQWKVSKKDELKFHLLLVDLFYQTPGGLTLAQWQANPRQARQATATLPGAEQQKIAVYNKTVLTGLSNRLAISKKLSNTTAAVFNYTDFKNPFITNYEKRKESSRGIRTSFAYKTSTGSLPLQFIAGAEWQTTFAHIDNYGNKNGVADTVQTKDAINAYQHFYFAQADLQPAPHFFITAGISTNGFTYRYTRTSDSPATPKKIKKFNPVLSPRLSLLYKPAKEWAVRFVASKGFSAPSMAEVRPSEGSFFESLQAEYGWNYETGIRADILKHRLQIDISVYSFNLTNAIVRRTAANGGEYFINAGGTTQKGIEAFAGYYFLREQKQWVSSLRLWTSLTRNNYHFKNYQSGTADYSGNKITGVPATVAVTGIDMEASNGFYVNLTYNYTSSLPLTDANSFYAGDYHLLQCKLGYQFTTRKKTIGIFAGADNILNEQYSLGNDINATGNRFYNAAPLRNYFFGISAGCK